MTIRSTFALVLAASMAPAWAADEPASAEPATLQQMQTLLERTTELFDALTAESNRVAIDQGEAPTPGPVARREPVTDTRPAPDGGAAPAVPGAPPPVVRIAPKRRGVPLRPGRDVEPNNSFGSATDIRAHARVRGGISPKRDVDWYRFRVRKQGELSIRTIRVPPEVDLVFRLWNGEKHAKSGWLAPLRKGGETSGHFDLKSPGDWYLEVRDGRDDAEGQGYEFEMSFKPTRDPYEPNDSFGTATSLPRGVPMRANILPKGDVDWYRVRVNHHGQLDVSVSGMPEKLDVAFRLWDVEKHAKSGWVSPPRKGADNSGFFDLPRPGSYWLEVRDGRNDERSAAPYSLLATWTPSPDGFEPNNTFGTASRVALGQRIRAAILPKGDVDWYRVVLPGAGVLSVEAEPTDIEMDMAVRVWDSEKHAKSGWFAPLRPGAVSDGTFTAKQAGTYYLEVRDGRNDRRSVKPYELRLRFSAN